MKLKVLDKFFWDYFKECPRKACLSYYDNNIFGYRPIKFRFKTLEQEKEGIFEATACKFFEELIEKKSISYTRLKEIFYYVTAHRLANITNGIKYSDDYKKQFREMIIELRNFKEFKEFAEILNPEDAVNMSTGMKATINLSEYANHNIHENNYKSIKSKFEYRINFPFYKRNKRGSVMPIHFNHAGYPFDFQDLNYELILTKLFFEKCVDEKMTGIIVYDFKTMKRYIVKDLKANFSAIRRILETIDRHLVYPNNKYERCIQCQHYKFCENNLYSKEAERMRKKYHD